jgi:hypothetical protein
MKLTIKTRDIKIEYEDEYSILEAVAKDRIESIIRTVLATPATAAPVKTTVEEFLKMK